MKGANRYLLDADTLMTAYGDYHRFSLCPAYWHGLPEHYRHGLPSSIVPVRNELLKGKDALSASVKDAVPEDFFHASTDQKVTNTCSTILNWVASPGHLQTAVPAKFASGADGWLVACAMVHGMSDCSYEVLSPEPRAKIKLPDVARQFGVTYLKPEEMLQHLGVRMVLGAKK
jgi:hypothetical protein